MDNYIETCNPAFLLLKQLKAHIYSELSANKLMVAIAFTVIPVQQLWKSLYQISLNWIKQVHLEVIATYDSLIELPQCHKAVMCKIGEFCLIKNYPILINCGQNKLGTWLRNLNHSPISRSKIWMKSWLYTIDLNLDLGLDLSSSQSRSFQPFTDTWLDLVRKSGLNEMLGTGGCVAQW